MRTQVMGLAATVAVLALAPLAHAATDTAAPPHKGSGCFATNTWESWSTQDDVDGLGNWTRLFGPDYLALFVFIYHVLPTVALDAGTPDLWEFRGEKYLLRAVTLNEYSSHVRSRSPKWGTVDLPGAAFRSLARPFRYYTHECPCGAEEAPDDGPDQARHLAEVTALALASFAAGGTAARRPGR